MRLLGVNEDKWLSTGVLLECKQDNFAKGIQGKQITVVGSECFRYEGQCLHSGDDVGLLQMEDKPN